jgi:hypothetical protein
VRAQGRVQREILKIVLVLERCCLQKRRVNPIGSAFPGLHPPSGLKVLAKPILATVAPEVTKVQMRCLLFGSGDGRGR